MRDWFREQAEKPRRLRVLTETACLALTTTFKVPKAQAEDVVRQAHITWKDSEGEAVVKALKALRLLHQQGSRGRNRR